MVKICGITSPDDAADAIDAGADALGFNFFQGSPRYVADGAWVRLVPACVLKVGVFVNEPPARVAELMLTYDLDVAQTYGDSTPENTRVWRAIRPGDPLLPAEAHLVDVSHGRGVAFDFSLARDLAPKVIVAGGLDASTVGPAIRAAHPWGVDACSRLESTPGRKDVSKMRAFVTAAREQYV